MTPWDRSSLPPCGSSSSPHESADSDTAIALIEKSRRAKSCRIESAGRTTGSAPGDGYSSARAMARSIVNSPSDSRAVLNCERFVMTPPVRDAMASKVSASALSRLTSRSAVSRPSSRSRTAPPTRCGSAPARPAALATARRALSAAGGRRDFIRSAGRFMAAA